MSSSREQKHTSAFEKHTSAFEKHMDSLKKESPLLYDLYRELNSFAPDKGVLQIDSEWKKLEKKIKSILTDRYPDKDYENK